MAITQTLTNVFRQDCLDGAHNLGNSGDTIKIALYTSSQAVSLDTSNNVAFFDAADPSFTSATITARGALIYNNSKSNAAIAVLDFGSDFSSSNGTFTVQFPTAAHNTALIRIS